MTQKQRKAKKIIDTPGVHLLQTYKYGFANFHIAMCEVLEGFRTRTVIYQPQDESRMDKTIKLFKQLRTIRYAGVVLIQYLDTYCERESHTQPFLELLNEYGLEYNLCIIVLSRTMHYEDFFTPPEEIPLDPAKILIEW